MVKEVRKDGEEDEDSEEGGKERRELEWQGR